MTSYRPTVASLIATLALLAAVATGAPAYAQPRQLGPPTGVDLEGTETEAGEKSDKTVEVPKTTAPGAAKPSAVDAAGTDVKGKDGMTIDKVKAGNGTASDTDIILDIPLDQIPNYRGMMRDIIEEMAKYARGRDPKFQVIARPGFDLLNYSQREYDLAEIKRDPTKIIAIETIRPVGAPMRRYMQSIDGFILDGQYCSPLRVPRDDLAAARKEGLRALAIDTCPDDAAVVRALQSAARDGIVTYATASKDPYFASLPKFRPIPENPGNVENLSTARNMMVLLSARSFSSREDWINAMSTNNYDILLIDAFDRNNKSLTKDDVHTLKFKQMGARRLVLAHIDIGRADDSRYYWQKDWAPGTPSWIGGMTPEVPGQYFVEFWNPAWKAIIGKYFAGILDLGFDGVVLDGVESYRRWEAKTPVTLAR